MAQVQSSYHSAVGRRKESVAKVRLFRGQSPIVVNDKPINEYFEGVVAQKLYQRPFEVSKTAGKFSATVKVFGGGKRSQLDAVVHGVARALVAAEAETRTFLKKAGLLTRDARVKERRKYGLAHKARAKKQSPKR